MRIRAEEEMLMAAEATLTTSDATIIRGVNPILPVDNISAAIAFWEDKLGFSTAFQYGEPTFYAGMRRGPIEIHLCRADDTSFADQMQLRIQVENIEPLYEEYKAQGVTHPAGLQAKPWGTKEFGILEPSGVGITVYEDLA
jgi:uncharacterized glyoxalase superfamily protein PhnB